ncbi:S-adenosyl-L-methionine-dependent methyltransferase [Russula earlei]|uniref:S-adenosyl-L-methionine-dependent methyltransferase n=1 Tax=Russula earlei TaxID=71964 RepID=A0ACC0UDF2_9AGAM|nr:S-adenosyl-L-methionine-dependent methyltransferase [Russula earlei]
MLHPLTQHPFLCIARSLVHFPSSKNAKCHRHARDIFPRPSRPLSRQLHDRPATDAPPATDQPPPPVSTINDDEVAHFSRLSALWWDEQGEFALLHKMNAHRMRFIREKVLEVRRDERSPDGGFATAARSSIESSPHALEGMDALDVGCGGGILSESLARLGANTLAIDASAENVGVATRHAAADRSLSALSFRHASAEALAQEPKRFDLVCSMEVVEHVDNPAAFLRACAELVKPGGHLFLSTIARTPLSYLLTIVAAEKAFRVVEPGTHTFSKFVDADELIGFFARPLARGARPWISRTYAHGLPTRAEAEVRGIAYIPWRGDWVLAPRATTPWSTQANYLFWARKPKDNP